MRSAGFCSAGASGRRRSATVPRQLQFEPALRKLEPDLSQARGGHTAMATAARGPLAARGAARVHRARARAQPFSVSCPAPEVRRTAPPAVRSAALLGRRRGGGVAVARPRLRLVALGDGVGRRGLPRPPRLPPQLLVDRRAARRRLGRRAPQRRQVVVVVVAVAVVSGGSVVVVVRRRRRRGARRPPLQTGCRTTRASAASPPPAPRRRG